MIYDYSLGFRDNHIYIQSIENHKLNTQRTQKLQNLQYLYTAIGMQTIN